MAIVGFALVSVMVSWTLTVWGYLEYHSLWAWWLGDQAYATLVLGVVFAGAGMHGQDKTNSQEIA
jgi:hypothetical protein